MFLTPLKPPTKSSVSAEAINSSLYYLHAASPDDYALLRESQLERQDQEERLREEGALLGVDDSLMGQLNNFRRKPVAGGGGSSSLTSPSASTLNNDIVSDNRSVCKYIFVPPSSATRSANLRLLYKDPTDNGNGARNDATQSPSSSSQTPSSPDDISVTTAQKRPVPPPPPAAAATKEDVTASEHDGPSDVSKEPTTNSMENGNEHQMAPQYSRSSSWDSRRHSSEGVQKPGAILSPLPPRAPYQGASNGSGLNITLVRRDPSHGSQWNVATMTSSPSDSSSFDIEVTTPGYSKFAAPRNDTLASLDGSGMNLPQEIRDAAAAAAAAAAASSRDQQHPSDRDRFKPGTFHRVLRISRPLQHEHRQPSVRHRSSSSASTTSPTHGGGWRSSVDTLSRLDTTVGHAATNIARNATRHKNGYYSFTSPWDGSCTFVASLNGQSLKCKHVLPSSFSPSVLKGADSQGSQQPPSVTVAELRFNSPFQMASAAMANVSASLREGGEGAISSTPSSSSANPLSKRQALSAIFNPNSYSTRSHFRSGSLNLSSSSSSYRPPSSYRISSSTSGDEEPDDTASTNTNANGNIGNGIRPPPLPRRTTADQYQQQQFQALDEDDDGRRMDFSLARENAGGGIKGDEAKLGKLIVEDEGIKMLDLVVAASMAVWWRSYYR